ncbi:Maf family protein [Stutzerimonas azotifigens]|uniref:7-methyl-GTP pyrophosphatase n=1 Tax=Stutzerimonas azotifigens TaxID=291995 RepID=A0ABR5YXU1_9GAMM|nr:nucleoside triphosphate pyrophosphatase [Stutzerimonas azotifigens]MBA1272758.1 septum formation inhibitor Maf [Stutzerimonas azotifigens]
MRHLLLASSSIYRRELLSRLRLPFDHAAPDIDETPHPQETAEALARRLAEQKTRALAQSYPQHLIIGSDQVAVLDQQILGKPLTFERARQQLQAASGKQVRFLTALALLNAENGHLQVDCIPFSVQFRQLSEAQIDRYLEAEQPYDCAGSFKVEGLGISLLRSTEGADLTSLIGLPLIRLVDMLANEGIEVP